MTLPYDIQRYKEHELPEEHEKEQSTPAASVRRLPCLVIALPYTAAVSARIFVASKFRHTGGHTKQHPDIVDSYCTLHILIETVTLVYTAFHVLPPKQPVAPCHVASRHYFAMGSTRGARARAAQVWMNEREA